MLQKRVMFWFPKRALDTVLLFTDLETQASYKKAPEQILYLSAESTCVGARFSARAGSRETTRGRGFCVGLSAEILAGCEWNSAHRFRGKGGRGSGRTGTKYLF